MPPLRPSDQSLLDRLNALKPTAITLGTTPNLTNPNPEGGTESPNPQAVSREDALAARLRILRSASTDESSNVNTNPTQPPSKSYPTGAQTHKPAGPVEETGDDPEWLVDGDLADLLDDFGEFDLDDPDISIDGNGRTVEDEDDKALEVLKTLRAKEDLPRASHTPAEGGKPEVNPEDDDSGAEHMSRSVENILAQVRDELGIEQDQEGGDPEAAAVAGTCSDTAGDDNSASLLLPTVPSSQPIDLDPTPHDPDNSQPAESSSPGGRRRRSLDFENDIAIRLASLRGLGSGVNLDSFGFPTAPAFRPEDRSASTAASLVSKKIGGYTDEDQKTWCIVCLDDATVRCVGCDNDVYCTRCWKDMHLGPSAGYDERGHKWAKFER